MSLEYLSNNAPDDDRTYWYKVVRENLEANNIAWTIWDYKGGFGLFEKNSNELFNYDLNTPLLNSLGLNEQPEQEYILKPDTVGFNIYTDYPGENILSYGTTGSDFWNSTDPWEGNFDLYWTGANQYNAINFSFKPVKDLSRLVTENYVIDFYMKGNEEVKLDLRFIDTKEDSTDHPWRIRYTLDSTKVKYNGEWQHIRIPLKNFTEHGSWDNNTWYIPEGKFDWSAVDRFEIDSEYGDMGERNYGLMR